VQNFAIVRHALSTGAVAALLAGCSSIVPQATTLPAAVPAAATSYKVLYRFSKNSSGEAQPYGGLVAVNGTLYGTTYAGGTYGYGTVYAISHSGEKTIYSFRGDSTDGAYPIAGLVNVNGTLYGTTFLGGSCCGVVFRVTTNGTETVLHDFKGGAHDGAGPQAGLINVNGTLYGTTRYGGPGACSYTTIGEFGCGTAYSITTSGLETVLHEFGSASDGIEPCSPPTYADGMLYGTTAKGGSSDDGVVYSMSASGSERVIHNFTGADGVGPIAPLLSVNGSMYGTTEFGGKWGHGAVYNVKTSGAEHVVFSFDKKTGGEHPTAGLVYLDGILYGTTTTGGGPGADCPRGTCGTLYGITPSGRKSSLHDFAGGTDGASPPVGALVDMDGTLYGTTLYGGGGPVNGNGTVYRFAP
jgi:uncharacterized repeat protein (TIGR03803 family)